MNKVGRNHEEAGMAEEELDLDDIQPQKSKMMYIIVAINVVALLGLGGYVFLGMGGDKAEAAEEKESELPELAGPATLVKLDSFIVNLNDAGGTRYLKLTAEIEVPGEKGAEIIANRRAPLRHSMISFLSSLTYADIAGADKKEEVRKALVEELNKQLNGEVVKNIYFTEFVIQ